MACVLGRCAERQPVSSVNSPVVEQPGKLSIRSAMYRVPCVCVRLLRNAPQALQHDAAGLPSRGATRGAAAGAAAAAAPTGLRGELRRQPQILEIG